MASNFQAYVSGDGGNNTLGNTSSTLNTIIDAGAGDDVLKGGKANDRLVGGQGDDIMSGGGGADQFFFSFSDVISGETDTDRIVDLNFAQGDSVVFSGYTAGFFTDAAGINGFSNGTAAEVSSFEGLKNLDNAHTDISASNPIGDLLILTFDYGGGTKQVIRISGGADDFAAAGGTFV